MIVYAKVAFVLKAGALPGETEQDRYEFLEKRVLAALKLDGFRYMPLLEGEYYRTLFLKKERLTVHSLEIFGYVDREKIDRITKRLNKVGVPIKKVNILQDNVYSFTKMEAYNQLMAHHKAFYKNEVLNRFSIRNTNNPQPFFYDYFSPPFNTYTPVNGKIAFETFLDALLKELMDENLIRKNHKFTRIPRYTRVRSEIKA